MAAAWTLSVARDDLADVLVVEHEVPRAGPGEVVLAADRVGMTANNVTYAVLGDTFRYWQHFPQRPGDDPDRGVVPVWGFADVVDSAAEGVEVGDRVYGYLPTASHLRLRPVRVGADGFRDGTPHRAALPSPYAVYARTSADAAYDVAREDLLVLFRPLFFTSFLLADFLVDRGLFGARQVLLTSASSKTAYGAAVELQRLGVPVAGLTSPAHVDVVRGLGCYDVVASYDDLSALDASDGPDDGGDVVVADVAGRDGLLAALRTRLGGRLRHVVGVGITHQVAAPAGTLETTGDAMFFAPDQMRKRSGDWGRDGLNARFAQAWADFADRAGPWVDVATGSGAAGLEAAWREVLAGTAGPRTGHVVRLRDP